MWEARDIEVHVSVSSFVAASLSRLKTAGDISLSSLLPKAVHTLVQQLGAEQDGVRLSVVRSIRRILEVRHQWRECALM